jgi:hypothetical protein
VQGGGTVESSGGGWGRVSGSGCERGGRRWRVGAERGGARGAARAESGGDSLTVVNHDGRQEGEETAAAGQAELRFCGEKRMRPRERERGGEEEAGALGWRRPAATLDQPAADGVAMPPGLANRCRQAASRGGERG